MATTYPRIHSLCTVGVRQHYNAEYLFHPVRTDFTGGNGLGKSIIADLMQLIIVPRRDIWKPGTEGIGKDERRIEGIPLNKEYIQYAYAFLNIEKKQGQFLVIGVYISKTPRIPVRPFIVQSSEEFELSNMIPFSRPLHPDDFLAENQSIFDLRELQKFLKEKHGLFMKDFFQHDGIMKYYDLLYKNHIIPVNLSKPDNLRTYSKIIQSFARAKSLDITNSKSLKDFLFEDNEEIKRTFEEQKDQLHSLLKQYRENFSQMQDIQLKQKKLLSLLETELKSSTARKEFLTASAVFACHRYTDALNKYESNKKQIESSETSLRKQKKELEHITRNLFEHYTHHQKICLTLRGKYTELLKNYSDEIIRERKLHSDSLRDKINLLSSLQPFLEKYGDAEVMEEKLKEQQTYREKKNQLQKLFSIPSFSDFEQSLWAKDDYAAASKYYSEKLSELPEQIEELETLIELFEGTREDSFFHWAIQQKKALTREQETVLMHLKELPVGKPGEFEEGTRYIENPKLLLSSFGKENGGIWITLGEVREFSPLVKKQRFLHPENLKTVLEKDTKETKQHLSRAHGELESIQRLSAELHEIGFNQEFAEIFYNSKEIEQYETDTSLNEEKIELVRKFHDDISLLETYRTDFIKVENEAIELAKKQTEIIGKINSLHQTLNQSEYDFTKLKLETNLSVSIDEINLSPKKTESLEKAKEKEETKIKSLSEQKIWTEKYIIAAESELKGYRNSEPVHQQQMEKTLAVFNEQKLLLESETGIVFEPSLISGELTENTIEELREKSEQAEESYHDEFTRVAESFEETKGNKNPELFVDKYNFRTLVNILCGKLGLEGLTPELERLNEELKKFGDLQLTIIIDVFKKVETQYHAFRKLITELNFFFKENRISGVYNFQVDFNERKDIAIDWIRRLREHAKHHRLSSKLFIHAEDKASAEDLILNLAKTLSDIGNCEISDLLDPKFYFDLRVGLYDDAGIRYSGSGGEAYTALALLCIGRMSVIQREKNRPGIRFIIIEELSNIDDTNFGLFPEIAKMFGYQLLTMTPKPFGSYTESEWYIHMLIRGKDKNINYHPMSFFRTRMGKQRLEEYMENRTAIYKIEQPQVPDAEEEPVAAAAAGDVAKEELSEVPGEVASAPNENPETNIVESAPIETQIPEINAELNKERKEEFLSAFEKETSDARKPKEEEQEEQGDEKKPEG